MTSVSALICHSIKLNPLIWLIQEVKSVKDFAREVRILLEFGIVPQVDALKLKDIYTICTALASHQIGEQIFFELLATEFARKQFHQEISFDNKCFILSALSAGLKHSTSLEQSMKFAFHDYVQACFLLSKQDDQSEEFLVPDGLFTNEIASRIRIAAEQLMHTKPERLLLCMVRLGWAKQTQLYAENVSSKQRHA